MAQWHRRAPGQGQRLARAVANRRLTLSNSQAPSAGGQEATHGVGPADDGVVPVQEHVHSLAAEGGDAAGKVGARSRGGAGEASGCLATAQGAPGWQAKQAMRAARSALAPGNAARARPWSSAPSPPGRAHPLTMNLVPRPRPLVMVRRYAMANDQPLVPEGLGLRAVAFASASGRLASREHGAAREAGSRDRRQGAALRDRVLGGAGPKTARRLELCRSRDVGFSPRGSEGCPSQTGAFLGRARPPPPQHLHLHASRRDAARPRPGAAQHGRAARPGKRLRRPAGRILAPGL